MHHFNYIRNENSEYYILINKTTEVTHSKRELAFKWTCTELRVDRSSCHKVDSSNPGHTSGV